MKKTKKSTIINVDEPFFLATAERGKKIFAKILRDEIGMSMTSYAILNFLSKGESSVQKLTEGIAARQSNISQRVDFLAKKNYLKKISNPTDHRSVGLVLTQSGRNLLQKFQKSQTRKLKSLNEFLTESELQNLKRIFQKLNRAMDQFCSENRLKNF